MITAKLWARQCLAAELAAAANISVRIAEGKLQPLVHALSSHELVRHVARMKLAECDLPLRKLKRLEYQAKAARDQLKATMLDWQPPLQLDVDTVQKGFDEVLERHLEQAHDLELSSLLLIPREINHDSVFEGA
ncbi:MAG: hypothetical protein MI808_22000 [Pseudomonadales bacterium]|nr:hypothetical protein [Pseudomonadales bacterium]